METIDKVTNMVKDTTYNRTFAYDAENDIVWLTQGTQLGKGDDARNVHFRYGMDMKDIELDELKVEGAKNIHITRMRTRCFKKLDEKAIAKLPLVLNPMDYPATGGAGITTRERKVRDLVDQLGVTREQAEYYLDNESEFVDLKAQMKATITKTILRKKE